MKTPTLIAWLTIPSLQGNEDSLQARHNILATLAEAGTNTERKRLWALADIVTAEGSQPPASPLERIKKRLQSFKLSALLHLQDQAYKRASHFGFASINGRGLSERSRQTLRDQQHEQLEIHDAVVDEIARRMQQARRVVWTREAPGKSPRPCPCQQTQQTQPSV